MKTVFRVLSSRMPRVDTVLSIAEALGLIAEPVEPRNVSSALSAFHVFHRGRSPRFLKVTWTRALVGPSHPRLLVSVPAGALPSDFIAARSLALSASRRVSGLVSLNGSAPMNPSEAGRYATRERFELVQARWLERVRKLASRKPCRLTCVRLPYTLGPKTLAQLTKSGSRMAAELRRRLCLLQYHESMGYRILRGSSLNEVARPVSVFPWSSGERILLGSADLYEVALAGRRPVVPLEGLVQLVPICFDRVDEEHVLYRGGQTSQVRAALEVLCGQEVRGRGARLGVV